MERLQYLALNCFNPCCTGYSSRAPYISTYHDVFTYVSILVVLDIAQERHTTERNEFHGRVSILVVLDIAQELLSKCLANMRMNCFNPCCTGYSSRAKHILLELICRHAVSILVVLDIAQEHDEGDL